MKTATRALFVAAALLVCPATHAVDAISLEVGESDSSFSDVNSFRLGAQWNWQSKWLAVGNWYLGGYWDVSAAYWSNDSDRAIRTSSDLIDLGVTPTLRWQQAQRSSIAPFVDLGLGLRYLSEDSITTLRDLSSNFQFGSVLGVGVRLGARHAYELSYRYEHLSNAGLKQPNNGINFQSLRLRYHF
ncbi:MAG: acyloxyacyl hydrolase [Proteobacteria bacterium]|nr:acyloxyacyl hydrolase [Burkholderiales bacterium]